MTCTFEPSAALVRDQLGPGGGSEESPLVADWKHGLSSSPRTLGQSTLFALGDAYVQSLAGEGKVPLCVIGGRDANSAEFSAAASIAVSWRLPVVFVVENIRNASGARQNSYVRERHGMPALSVDGKDVEAVCDSASEAVQRASAGGGPTFVGAATHRTNDASGVDPLVFARRQLIDAGVSAICFYEVERRARHLAAEAEAFAKAMSRLAEPASVKKPDTLVGC
jgi:TPP-dependent pyruvate/acetoin dehydrogenase alpha subunit